MDTTTWHESETRAIAELLKDIDICMFLTRSDGSMRGRPMSNNGLVEYDGDSWFFSARDSGKVRDIQTDPRVGLAYVATDRGTWVSIEGRAEVVDDDARKRALWQDQLQDWFPGGPDDDGVVLLKVRADRVHAWTDGQELVVEPGSGVTRIPQETSA